MKCWCFNEEQLEAALIAWADRQYGSVPIADQPVVEATVPVIRSFLNSPEAREHKLGLHGMWDREEPKK